MKSVLRPSQILSCVISGHDYVATDITEPTLVMSLSGPLSKKTVGHQPPVKRHSPTSLQNFCLKIPQHARYMQIYTDIAVHHHYIFPLAPPRGCRGTTIWENSRIK